MKRSKLKNKLKKRKEIQKIDPITNNNEIFV